MEMRIDKCKPVLKSVGPGKVGYYRLSVKGEEQDDGSVIVRLSVADKSGKPIPRRWHTDAVYEVTQNRRLLEKDDQQ